MKTQWTQWSIQGGCSSEECPCTLRLPPLLTVSLGRTDQSALGSTRDSRYALGRPYASAVGKPCTEKQRRKLWHWTVRSPLGLAPDERFSHFVVLVRWEQPGIFSAIWRPRTSGSVHSAPVAFPPFPVTSHLAHLHLSTSPSSLLLQDDKRHDVVRVFS